MAEFLASKEWATFLQILPTIPFETWETIWSTAVATLLALVIGLPLGVCLVTGEQGGVRPLPRWVMSVLNAFINLLRSVPFLILMIIVIPLSRLLVGTSIGTPASIVPLVIASFPFVARLVETSIREVDCRRHRSGPEHGRHPAADHHQGDDPREHASLISNVTIATTTIMGYGAMAGIIGGGGLGKIAINYGYYRFNVVLEIFATVLLVILVQILQTVGTRWPSAATSGSSAEESVPEFSEFIKGSKWCDNSDTIGAYTIREVKVSNPRPIHCCRTMRGADAPARHRQPIRRPAPLE